MGFNREMWYAKVYPIGNREDNSSLDGVIHQLLISDFHIGFEYEELQMDSERYLNKGMIWVKKKYGFNSPRLHKINELIEAGKLRHSNAV